MSGEKKFKQLVIWQKAITLANSIYNCTKLFPEGEKFCLVNQLRRAAVSVPSNIAEGSTRQGDKEFVQFLYIAKSSLAEIETQLIIAQQQSYLTEDAVNILLEEINHVDNGIFGLITTLKKRG